VLVSALSLVGVNLLLGIYLGGIGWAGYFLLYSIFSFVWLGWVLLPVGAIAGLHVRDTSARTL